MVVILIALIVAVVCIYKILTSDAFLYAQEPDETPAQVDPGWDHPVNCKCLRYHN